MILFCGLTSAVRETLAVFSRFCFPAKRKVEVWVLLDFLRRSVLKAICSPVAMLTAGRRLLAVGLGLSALGIGLASVCAGQTTPTERTGLQQHPPVRVGALANRGEAICFTEWSPTARYLSEQLAPRDFVIVPLDFSEVRHAAENRTVDFLLVNSSMYVALEYDGLVYRIATFQQPSPKSGEGLPVFGGVIFCRADRKDMLSLRDLVGKRFGAVEPSSFGGWQAAWRELKRMGIQPDRDFSGLTFFGTHDAVVEAVLDGRIDAGTVRSTQLERMAMEGAINLNDIRVFPGTAPSPTDYPFLLSTPLYPEWPLAAVKGVDLELGKSVASALLRMDANDPAAQASRGAGWAIPQDYTSLHECLRELRLHPYETYGKVSLRQAIAQYWAWIAGAAFVLACIIVLALWAVRGSIRLRDSLGALEASERKYRNVVENIQDVYHRVDSKGCFEMLSPSAADFLGFGAVGQLIGNRADSFWADPSKHQELVDALMEAGHVRDWEYLAVRRDGTVLTAAATVQRVGDAGELFMGYEGIWRDISDRKRAEESLHRQNQYLAALHEMSIGLMSRIELDHVLEAIIARASALVGTPHTFIYVYDPERQDLEIRAATGYYRDSVGYRIAPGIGLGGTVWQTGQLLVVPDYSTWKGRSPDKRWDEYHSVVGVPLRSCDQVWGVIGAACLKKGEVFGQEEADILQRFAALASIAYDNAQLYASLQKELRDRKQAEEALLEAHNRLNAIIDFLPDATFVISREGEVIAWNRTIEEMTGVSKADIIGKGDYEYAVPFYGERRPILIDLVLSQHAELIRSHYDQSYQQGDVLCGEVYVPNLHGGRGAYLWGSASVLLDSKGQVAGAIESIRDITDRKESEQALLRSEQRLALALQATKDAVWDWDLLKNEMYYSPRWAGMLGYPEEEMDADPDLWIRLIHPDDRDGIHAALNEALEKGDSFEAEARLLHKNGHYAPLRIQAIILRDATGQATRASGTFADLTEQKRGEEERRRWEKRLQEAHKTESLARMAGAVAHHFNNMLGAVIGNLELGLEDLPASSPVREFLVEAMKASRRAVEISELMLAYLGQTTGKQEPVDLSECCRETLALLDMALLRNVELESDFSSSGPVVMADRSKIKQVIANLVANASEALDGGKGRIGVSVRVVSGEAIHGTRFYPSDWEPKWDLYGCLEVVDTGPGLEAATLERIFDPFFSTKFTGRGLGLPVVLGVVRALDGVVAVESRPSKGATFRVYLPLWEGDASRPAVGEEEARPLAVPGGEAERLVLLVEDERAIRDLIREMLRRLGCRVVATADGVEALKVFRAHKDEFHLVIIDAAMPGMDGWETLAALRAMRPGLPAVLSSGHERDQVMQASRREQPDCFLQKPFRFSDLKAILAMAGKDHAPGVKA